MPLKIFWNIFVNVFISEACINSNIPWGWEAACFPFDEDDDKVSEGQHIEPRI